MLADQLLQNVDERLGAACEAAGLSYTRFVDDITISGPFDLEPSGFATLVERVLGEHGFCVNPQKHEYGSLSEGFDVTGIRIRKGRLDAKQEYVAELERQLDDAASLAAGREFIGPFFTRSQILGRVQFVVWVNPGRNQQRLRQRFTSRNRRLFGSMRVALFGFHFASVVIAASTAP